jgi:hypothetical protein
MFLPLSLFTGNHLANSVAYFLHDDVCGFQYQDRLLWRPQAGFAIKRRRLARISYGGHLPDFARWYINKLPAYPQQASSLDTEVISHETMRVGCSGNVDFVNRLLVSHKCKP